MHAKLCREKLRLMWLLFFIAYVYFGSIQGLDTITCENLPVCSCYLVWGLFVIPTNTLWDRSPERFFMKSIKHCSLLFLGLALVMIIMSACSQGSTPSSLSPLQVLQKSASAMKNVKTDHVDLNVTSQISGANATGLATPSNMNITLQGSGDQSIPDNQQKMDLTVSLYNLSAQVSEVMTNNKVYIKTPQGQWYSLDKNTISEQSGCNLNSLFSGKTIDQNNLLGLIGHIQVTDHGTENVNGQSLRHITANMDKATLKQLVSDNPQLKCAVGSLDLNTVKNLNASVDVFIDEQQFYVHRTQIKINQGTDNNGTTTSANSNVIMDLSNFNQPVTITAPTNATPLTDPKQLLGGLNGLLK
jgi:hypothetical protein